MNNYFTLPELREYYKNNKSYFFKARDLYKKQKKEWKDHKNQLLSRLQDSNISNWEREEIEQMIIFLDNQIQMIKQQIEQLLQSYEKILMCNDFMWFRTILSMYCTSLRDQKQLTDDQASLITLKDCFNITSLMNHVKKFDKKYLQHKKLIDQYEKQGGYSNESIRQEYVNLKILQSYYQYLNVKLMVRNSAVSHDESYDQIKCFKNDEGQYEYDCIVTPKYLQDGYNVYYAMVNEETGKIVVDRLTLDKKLNQYSSDEIGILICNAKVISGLKYQLVSVKQLFHYEGRRYKNCYPKSDYFSSYVSVQIESENVDVY